MKKLVDTADKIVAPWLKDFGNYNNMPKPFSEITVDEYIHLKGNIVNYYEHRHISHGNIGSIHIEWFYDFGLAVRYPTIWKPENNKIIYKEPIKYYKIGCNHSFVELSYNECKESSIPHFGRCWHVYKCTICGTVNSADSSD
jgi:hypothetical protein